MHKDPKRQMQTMRWIYGLLLMALALSLSGCGEGLFMMEMDDVLVAFDREPGAELIGFYVAEEWLIYDQHALDTQYAVNLDTGANIQSVVNGHADFGIASSQDLALARAQGLDVVGIASIYRYNPTVMVTIGDKLVKRPRDLRGKRIAVDSLDLHTLNDLQFVYMIERIGLDIGEMDLVASAVSIRDNLLIGDQVDVATGLSATRDVLLLREQGYDARMHHLGEYGVLVYPMILFTTGERIEQDADYVQRFVQATLWGYEEALKDVEGAIATLPQSGLDPAFESLVMDVQISYLDPVDAPVGWMNLSVWERSLELLPPVLVDTVPVFECYTNEFVQDMQLEADGE